MSMKRWMFSPIDKEKAAQLSEACELPPFLALLLTARGLTEPDEVKEFLEGGELSDDPFAFADMDVAVDRIQRALDGGERITIFGDYDADGITATVLLYTYLREKGAQVRYLLPQREGEGYGLRTETIERLAEQQTQLLITVDNGVAAVEEVALANSLGIDVVVTDHHLPPDRLPDAVAVVNPHRADCESGFKDYAGVGVAFKLVCALEGDDAWALSQYADLVALGTLADIMPLRGENRVLVREGLKLINAGTRPGLTALAEVAGAGGKVQTSTSAVFTLAPRINAAGRMGDPLRAAELLLAETAEEAAQRADEINGYNVQRQQMESVTMEEVTAQIDAHPEWMRDRVLVIAGEGWSGGIVGILAARILERYGKPCMLLSILPDKVKGSGRSFKGFPLFDAIASCADILTSFGGHELAAGVSLAAEHVDEFRRRINEYAAAHFPVMPVPTLTLDCKVSPAQVKLDILDEIARLEPFGTGNPFPVFGLYRMVIQDITPVGGGKHLRLSLTRDGANLTVMWFHMTEADCPFFRGDTVDIAATFDRNEFRGVASVTVIVKDIAFSQADREGWLDATQQFDELLRDGRSALTKAALLPQREELAVLYRYLRGKNGFSGRWDGLRRRLPAAVPPLKLRLGLEILRQAGLLTVTDRGDTAEIAVLPTESKADLTQTPLWQTIDHMA